MALETVEITVQDDAVVPGLVDDVVVRVFDADGIVLITEGTTGDVDPGKVQFTLEGDDPPERYQLRFFISGGSIASPQYIDVYSPASAAPTGANNFLITAQLFTLPTASNPRLCRASGFVWGPDGRPIRGIDITFIPLFAPLVADDHGVLGERVDTRTDKDGYVQVDLLRNGMYFATVQSHENTQRQVMVPSRSSINMMHLLFPIVVRVEYDSAPIGVGVGADLVVVPTVTANDYRVLEGSGVDDVQYIIDDPTIAGLTISKDNLTIHGYAAGTTQLRVTRKDSSIVYIPDPGIDGAITAITVS